MIRINWRLASAGHILQFMLVEKHPPSPEQKPVAATDLSFVDKSNFLTRGDAHRPPVSEVALRETQSP